MNLKQMFNSPSQFTGALADRGLSLDQLYEKAVELTERIATMSVSLTACDVPGSGASFELGINELELGLGIHGEPGVKRTDPNEPLLTSREAVHLVVQSIVDSLATRSSQPKRFARIALLINNTGGLANFDFNVVTNDVIHEVTDQGMVIDRIMAGSFCTSFSMSGVSVSILMTNDEINELLDVPCDSPVFKSNPPAPLNPDPIHETPAASNGSKRTNDWFEIPGVSQETFGHMVQAAAKAMIESEQLLNDLDRCGGDADCGLTAKKGASGILKFMEESNTVPTFLDLASLTSQMGGTSGAIYSLLFTSVHASIRERTEQKKLLSIPAVTKFWSDTLTDAIRVVTTYSWAEPGDRTMLDTIHAVQRALQHVPLESSPCEILTAVANAAEEGAQATADMDARAGRSSYASQGTIDRQPDAGAVGVAVWIRAAIKSVI